MTKKNSELPKIRISTDLFDQMVGVVKQLNKNEPGIEINMSTFRRMAYKHFVGEVMSEGIKVNFMLLTER